MISKLVLYPIGVTKLMFAPNKTERTKGSIGAPNWMAILIATGVPKTAAALFETTLVKSAINNIKTLRITGIGKEAVK